MSSMARTLSWSPGVSSLLLMEATTTALAEVTPRAVVDAETLTATAAVVAPLPVAAAALRLATLKRLQYAMH